MTIAKRLTGILAETFITSYEIRNWLFLKIKQMLENNLSFDAIF